MKCPCEGCIVFIMCKRTLMKDCGSQVMQLSKTCPYLLEYIREVITDTETHTITTRKVFGLMDWGPARYKEYETGEEVRLSYE